MFLIDDRRCPIRPKPSAETLVTVGVYFMYIYKYIVCFRFFFRRTVDFVSVSCLDDNGLSVMCFWIFLFFILGNFDWFAMFKSFGNFWTVDMFMGFYFFPVDFGNWHWSAFCGWVKVINRCLVKLDYGDLKTFYVY